MAKNEIIFMKYLEHPNIMAIRDIYEDDKNLILIMNLMAEDFRNVLI